MSNRAHHMIFPLAALFLFAALAPELSAQPKPGLEFLAGVGPAGSEVWDVAVGPDGSVYIAGMGPGPESSGRQWTSDEWDVFVAKLSPDGQTLRYLKFIGGSRFERADSLKVDASGAAYVAGSTSSPDFPVLGGGYRAPNACGQSSGKDSCLEVFVAKLDPGGSEFVYSALLGGSAADMAAGLAIDQAGAAYVTGTTMSTDFPVTPFALQKSQHGAPWASDAFLAKINPAGDGLVFSTYLGGNGDDSPLGVAVDGSGQPLIAISSEGLTVIGGADVTGKTYVARIGELGEYASVIAQTDLETYAWSLSRGFVLDNRGSAYVIGAAAWGECEGQGVSYIWKASLDGARDGYSRCFDFPATGLALDRNGGPIITGRVSERYAPQVTAGAIQTCVNGDSDAIVLRLDAAGEVAYSTFLGGSKNEEIAVVGTGMDNAAYVAAATNSPDFPPPLDSAQPAAGIAVAKVNFATDESTTIQCVANGASWVAGAITPGEVLSVTGWGLGPREPAGLELDSSGRVKNELGGTRLLFDGVAAPLLYAGEGQVNAVAPFELTPGEVVELQLERHGTVQARRPMFVAPFAPGIFSHDASGVGQAAAVNQDGTLNSPSNPADRGSVVSIYVTGVGPTQPPSIDGAVTGGEPLPRLTNPPEVRVDGRLADLLYAGAAPGIVAGVVQINLRVPDDVLPGPDSMLWLSTAPYFSHSQTQRPTLAVR